MSIGKDSLFNKGKLKPFWRLQIQALAAWGAIEIARMYGDGRGGAKIVEHPELPAIETPSEITRAKRSSLDMALRNHG